MFKTEFKPHRPKYVFYYRLWKGFEPTFILDIGEEYEQKMRALMAYQSQFKKDEKATLTKDNDDQFHLYISARQKVDGYETGAKFGEPYFSLNSIGVKNLDSIMPNNILAPV